VSQRGDVFVREKTPGDVFREDSESPEMCLRLHVSERRCVCV